MAFCPEPLLVPQAFSGIRPFEGIPAINMVHNVAPRFGNTANITNLVVGSSEEAGEYLRGVLAGAIALVVVFFVWCVLLVYFKCRGPERYGWLSGSRRKDYLLALLETDENGNRPHNVLMEEDLDPQENDLHLNEEEAHPKNDIASRKEDDDDMHGVAPSDPSKIPEAAQDSQMRRIRLQDRVMRWSVILSALAIVICSIIMVSKGVPGLNNIVDDGRDSLVVASNLVVDAISVANIGEKLLNETIQQLEGFATNFNEACPNLGDELCVDIRNVTTCRNSGIIAGKFIYFRILDEIYSRYDDVLPILQAVQSDLLSVDRMLLQTYNTFDDVDWLFHLSSFFAIMLMCVCLVVMGSLCIDFHIEGPIWAKTKLWSRRFFFPVFVFLVLFAFSFAIAFVVASTGIADACVESPDDRLKRLLIDRQSEMNPLSAEIVEYYIKGCVEPPKSVLQGLFINGSNLLADFVAEMGNATQVSLVEEVCGPVDSLLWVELAESMSEKMCRASDILGELRGFFGCSTWFALYESLVYNTLCYNVDALSLIAFTQVFVVCFAFVVVTCRVVIYEPLIEQETSGPPAENLSPPVVVPSQNSSFEADEKRRVETMRSRKRK